MAKLLPVYRYCEVLKKQKDIYKYLFFILFLLAIVFIVRLIITFKITKLRFTIASLRITQIQIMNA